MALQRWMVSVISLIIVWLTINVVMWLTTDPSLLDLANFFLPLALLPLLSSPYAEVNLEGARLLKVCIRICSIKACFSFTLQEIV